MDSNNRNISDTFGKYNNADGINELKNVSSSMWEPISAGRSNTASSAGNARPQQTPIKSAPNKGQSAPRSAAKKSSQKKNTNNTKNKSSEKDNLISKGKPQPQKKKDHTNKNSSKTAASKKTSSKKPPVSRTPVGRDMREDARQNQKHREELFKSREEYERRTKSGENHDEISRKRNAKKRKKLIVKNAVTVGTVLVFAVVFILIYCYSRGALIETVIIDGESVYSSEQIQAAAGIERGKNMLSLREKKVKKDITKKLPYIKDVKMEYDLPDTVILTIKATSDKYVITGQNSWLTLDTDGKIVSDKKQKIKSGMFRVDGFDVQNFVQGETYVPEGANKERYRLMEKMVSLFEKSDVIDTAVINLQNIEDVVVTVDGKVAVYLGNCKNLEEKIPYTSGIIAEVRNTGKSGYVDMRFEVGYFKPGSMTIQ